MVVNAVVQWVVGVLAVVGGAFDNIGCGRVITANGEEDKIEGHHLLQLGNITQGRASYTCTSICARRGAANEEIWEEEEISN